MTSRPASRSTPRCWVSSSRARMVRSPSSEWAPNASYSWLHGARQASSTTPLPSQQLSSKQSSRESKRQALHTAQHSIPSEQIRRRARKQVREALAPTLYFNDPNKHLLEIRTYEH